MSANDAGEPAILVYGTPGCSDCLMAKRVLAERQASYTWIDITHDADAADMVVRINGGYRTVPTILFPDGRVLVEPSRRELEDALTESDSAA